MPTQSHRGVQSALLAALLFGASTPLAKGLLASVPPQVLAGLLYLGSGLGLGALWIWRRRAGSEREAALTRRDLPWLVGAIGFGGFLGPLLLLIGLSHTPASAASLFLNLEGVFTAILAWVVFRENVDRRIALGMGAIVAGGAVLAWQGRLERAVSRARSRLPRPASAGRSTTISPRRCPPAIRFDRGAQGGHSWYGQSRDRLLPGRIAPDPAEVGAALLLGFVGYGLSLVLFVLALRSLGTARTGAYFSTAPFVGAILSVLFWREPVTPIVLAAGGSWRSACGCTSRNDTSTSTRTSL